MKISIITSCYNREATIAEAIRSVMGQDYGEVEYIVVDGASTDGSLKIIENLKAEIESEDFRKKHQKFTIKVISEADHGMYEAINKGIKMATGDIIGLVHSDDTLYDCHVLTNIAECFKKTNADGFNGMTRGEAFYRPMLEVVEYLLDNEFIVYICSGTNRFTVRGLIDGVIDIPARQVIGTDFTIVATGQGEEMDMHYTFTADDELLMGDTLITKNVKMSKVAQMEQELGQKPVLVFGNSSGDVPMAVYAVEDNPYKTAAFFLLCDDVERERGNLDKAASMKKTCEEKGWTTISMANDWTTIFGADVAVIN